MSNKKLPAFWETSRNRLIVSGILFAALAYLFVSLSIDSGSLVHYFITFVAAFIAGKMFGRAIRFNTHGKK